MPYLVIWAVFVAYNDRSIISNLLLAFAISTAFRCKLDNLNDSVETLLKDLALHCKRERRAKTKTTLRSLSKKLDVSENYLSALENGRVTPSMKTFNEDLSQVPTRQRI